MYCKYCGGKNESDAVFCSHCGGVLKNLSGTQAAQASAKKDSGDVQPVKVVVEQAPTKTNGFAIAGFVLSLCAGWLLGLIFSGIGVAKRQQYSKANGLAFAGLVISLVSMAVSLIWVWVIVLVAAMAML